MSVIMSSYHCPLIPPAVIGSFTDDFQRADVNPMNNGWLQADPVNQKFAQIIGGRAFGTAVASATPPPYNDANAYRANFAVNHEVEFTIYKAAGIPSTPNMEVEALLRWSEGVVRTTSFGDSGAYGYEININQNGDYLILSRYLAATELTRATTPPAVANGDKLRARIEGQRIRVYYTPISTGIETLHIDFTDSTAGNYTTGAPGMGFFSDNGGSATQLGIETITLRSL